MKAFGIIAEYNPFHDGHRFLIEESRSALGAEICVSVMSGPFSQRGFPCLYDKWKRAEDAVRGGIDLVVELPVVYATGSAELFAKGAVGILESFGSIDYLAFGSESGDMVALQRANRFLREHAEAINKTAARLQRKGDSYPKARELACRSIDPGFPVSLVQEPNNILALSYLQWLDKMKPHTVRRADAGYHETGSILRKQAYESDPERFRRVQSSYFDLVRYSVLRMTEKEIGRISGADGGLGNKLRKEIVYASDLNDLIDRTKSKAYTRTRITRLLTHVLLNITEEWTGDVVPYIRVLGCNRRGTAFLKHCRQNEKIRLPVLTNVAKERGRFPEISACLEKDILASQLYALMTGDNLYRNHDLVRKPVIL